MSVPKQFNAEEDADALQKAIKSKDSKEIIRILANRKNSQRQEIKKQYISSYGEDLKKELKKKLSGNFRDCITALLYTPVEYDVKQLRKAIEGVGTDEDTLIEIISTRPKWKIEEIKKRYIEKYNTTLEKDIIGDTSGIFKNLLIALISGGRSENVYPNEKKCLDICDKLYEGGEKIKGVDKDLFIKTFSTCSKPELAMISRLYELKYKTKLIDVLNSEFKGDERNLFKALLQSIINSSEYFATKVFKAVDGLGTKNNMLIRVLVTRDEVDMKKIKKYYKKLYKTDMLTAIENDTSGDYKNLLIEIVRH